MSPGGEGRTPGSENGRPDERAGLRLVVVGASAGGVESLRALAASLPPDFPAAVLVVLHVSPHGPSWLPRILSRAGPLPAEHPLDGTPLRPGHIYVAPPDHHLLVEDGHLTVRRGPKENRFRPSVDALFRSAAYTHGPQVVGVVLSGALDDGTSGLWTVKRLGGVTIVQDPSEAAFDSMPLSALREVEVDYTLPIAEIGPCLVRLVEQPPHPRDEVNMDELDEAERLRLAVETRVAAQAPLAGMSLLELAEPSIFSCPECRGVLLKVHEGSGVRYRCHVGHAYSASALLAGVTDTVEVQLEQALRALEEAVELLQHQHGHARLNGDLHAAALLRSVLAGMERRMNALSDRLALFDQTH